MPQSIELSPVATLFFEDLNLTSEDLCDDRAEWKVGDTVEVPDWSEEKGDYYETHEITALEQDEAGRWSARTYRRLAWKR